MRIVIEKKYQELPETAEPERYKHRGRLNFKKSECKLKRRATNQVNEHIRSFPTVPSHYCRRNNSKFYFE